MKDFTAVVLGLVGGIGIFLIGATINTFGDPTQEQIGHTYGDLVNMKKECEEDLPRNQQCTVLVQYLPQQEGK